MRKPYKDYECQKPTPNIIGYLRTQWVKDKAIVRYDTDHHDYLPSGCFAVVYWDENHNRAKVRTVWKNGDKRHNAKKPPHNDDLFERAVKELEKVLDNAPKYNHEHIQAERRNEVTNGPDMESPASDAS